MSALKLRFLHKGAAAVSAYYTYDNSIGVGNVDSAGFANLPLRAGATRYYINSAHGSASDSNAGTNPSLPWATAAKAAAKMQVGAVDGTGSQFLFAEGTTYAELIPTVAFLNGGFSLQYPLVLQSYDPTDPTNEAKIGRASGAGSHARPQFTGNNVGVKWGFTGAQQFIAVRGLDFNPGDIGAQSIGCELAGDGFLIENNIFRFIQIGVDSSVASGGAIRSHWIFRNNSIYGAWNPLGGGLDGALSGIYIDGCDSVTIEDNVIWNAGWRASNGTRGDGTASGNASIYAHAIYQQGSDVGTCVTRRNFISDNSADGGSFRADALVTGNLFFNNPSTVGLGGGHGYDIRRPYGDSLDYSYNVAIGSGAITSNPASANGPGITTSNGKSGGLCLAHHNVLAHGTLTGGNGNFAYIVETDYNQSSNLLADQNVTYQWNPSGNTSLLAEGAFTGTCHFTGTNNYWDDPASGSNLNISSGTFPHTYDVDALCAAAGYTNKASAIAYAIANPEQRIQRNIVPVGLAAYAVTSGLRDLALDASFVTGQKNSTTIVGTIDGSTLTSSGFPANATINNDSRALVDDGTATVAASGSWSITETHPTLGSHTTSGTWTTYLAPKLTSPTSSSVTATTATIGATSDTGSGSLCYVVTPTALTLPWQAQIELHHNTDTVDYFKFGNQTLSSSGAKTASLTGLTTATTYYVYWVQTITSGGRKIYSTVANSSFTTS